MKVHEHFILGAVISAIMIAAGIGIESALAFLAASFLIDIDHLIGYALKFKSIDWKKAKKQFEGHELAEVPILKAFHSVEFLVFTLVLSLLGTAWFFLFLGVGLHLAIDFVQQQFFCPEQIRKKGKRSWSIVLFFLKYGRSGAE